MWYLALMVVLRHAGAAVARASAVVFGHEFSVLFQIGDIEYARALPEHWRG